MMYSETSSDSSIASYQVRWRLHVQAIDFTVPERNHKRDSIVSMFSSVQLDHTCMEFVRLSQVFTWLWRLLESLVAVSKSCLNGKKYTACL